MLTSEPLIPPPATIPSNTLPTPYRPNLVLISGFSISLLELTVCSNTPDGFLNARQRKQSKQSYIELLGDLESAGYCVQYETLEIGSLGHYNRSAYQALRSLIPDLLNKAQCTELLKSRGVASIGLRGLEPPFCNFKLGPMTILDSIISSLGPTSMTNINS